MAPGIVRGSTAAVFLKAEVRAAASNRSLLRLSLLGLRGEAAQGCACAAVVELLPVRLRRRTKRARLGDLVAVAVGGDDPGVAPPPCCRPLLLRRRAKGTCPRLVIGQRGVEDSVGAGLDEVAAFGQRPPHLSRHRASRLWDEAGDQGRSRLGATGACGSGGSASEAVVHDLRDVAGVSE